MPVYSVIQTCRPRRSHLCMVVISGSLPNPAALPTASLLQPVKKPIQDFHRMERRWLSRQLTMAILMFIQCLSTVEFPFGLPGMQARTVLSIGIPMANEFFLLPVVRVVHRHTGNYIWYQ